MTDLQYTVLRKVRDNQPCPDELFTGNELLILNTCASERWVRCTREKLLIVMTSRGDTALLEHESQLQQQAEQRAREEAARKARDQAEEKRWRQDARRSWAQFWLGGLFGLIGFAAGVAVEHWFSVLELLLALF